MIGKFCKIYTKIIVLNVCNCLRYHLILALKSNYKGMNKMGLNKMNRTLQFCWYLLPITSYEIQDLPKKTQDLFFFHAVLTINLLKAAYPYLDQSIRCRSGWHEKKARIADNQRNEKIKNFNFCECLGQLPRVEFCSGGQFSGGIQRFQRWRHSGYNTLQFWKKC